VTRADLTGDAEALRAFWAVFHARSGARRCVHRTRYSRWRAAEGCDLIISQYVTNRSVGVFLRGPRGERWRATAARLEPVRDALSSALDADMGEAFLFPTRARLDTYDDALWPAMADWLHAEADRYVEVMAALTKDLLAATPCSALVIPAEAQRRAGTGGPRSRTRPVSACAEPGERLQSDVGDNPFSRLAPMERPGGLEGEAIVPDHRFALSGMTRAEPSREAVGAQP
jgi:hypothetical protein